MRTCVIAFAVCAALAAGPVLADEGVPVGGIGVSVEQSPGGIIVSQTQTDATGTVTLRRLKPGSYVARCTSGPCRGKILRSFTVTTSSASVTVSANTAAPAAN